MVVASIDGAEVGAAALGIAGDTAILFSAAVLPAFRRRGVHSALLLARLALAASRGADNAVVKTTKDSPAEHSTLKHGFVPTNVRRRLRREPAA